ncbi:hypothetical protein J3R83DRAFT_2538 [Lanmaoa asiatica]|nr:hypothetical protein J3R83DRAFT_2538 [Lanmaoa asiatica]
MPTGTTLTPSTQTLPDTPAPKRTFGHPDVQTDQISATTQSGHALFSPPAPHTATPSIHLQSATDYDSDANSAVPQSVEDEYTLSAYGDISLSEVVVPPLPAPTRPSPGPLQPGIPQPRLRLKVQRPPMPKRRLSYYAPDPMPHSGGMKPDEHWPCSPRLVAYVSASVPYISILSLTTTLDSLSESALEPTSTTGIPTPR